MVSVTQIITIFRAKTYEQVTILRNEIIVVPNSLIFGKKSGFSACSVQANYYGTFHACKPSR